MTTHAAGSFALQPMRAEDWLAVEAIYREGISTGHATFEEVASATGRGVGSLLLAGLIEAIEDAGYWTLKSSIFPENTASVRLHQHHGFRIIGTPERITLMT